MSKSHTYNKHDILIRELLEKDIPEIVSSFASIDWQKPSTLFENYLKEVRLGSSTTPNRNLSFWD